MQDYYDSFDEYEKMVTIDVEAFYTEIKKKMHTPYAMFAFSLVGDRREFIEDMILEGETYEGARQMYDELHKQVLLLSDVKQYKSLLEFFVLVQSYGQSVIHPVADSELTEELINFHFTGVCNSPKYIIETDEMKNSTRGHIFPVSRIALRSCPQNVYYAIPPRIYMNKVLGTSWNVTQIFLSGDQLNCILIKDVMLIRSFEQMQEDVLSFYSTLLDVTELLSESELEYMKNSSLFSGQPYPDFDSAIRMWIFQKINRLYRQSNWERFDQLRKSLTIHPIDMVRIPIDYDGPTPRESIAPFSVRPYEKILIGWQEQDGYYVDYVKYKLRDAIVDFVADQFDEKFYFLDGKNLLFRKGITSGWTESKNLIPFFQILDGDNKYDIIFETLYSSTIMKPENRIYQNIAASGHGRFQLVNNDGFIIRKFGWSISEVERKMSEFVKIYQSMSIGRSGQEAKRMEF